MSGFRLKYERISLPGKPFPAITTGSPTIQIRGLLPLTNVAFPQDFTGIAVDLRIDLPTMMSPATTVSDKMAATIAALRHCLAESRPSE